MCFNLCNKTCFLNPNNQVILQTSESQFFPIINISCLPLPTSVSGARLRVCLQSGTSGLKHSSALLFEAQYLSINGIWFCPTSSQGPKDIPFRVIKHRKVENPNNWKARASELFYIFGGKKYLNNGSMYWPPMVGSLIEPTPRESKKPNSASQGDSDRQES